MIDVPVDPDAAPRAVDLDACARVLAGVGELGIPIYGSGLVLDRGHPHMYVILPLGAPVEHVDIIAEFLRDQAGIGNAYPTRFESGRASDD
ncbi:MAG: hypothetical protein ABJD11_15945 [Gemmatimonadota bacterium]